MLVFTIVMCVGDNADKLMATMGEHYEETLPIYSVETDEKVVSITFDAAWGVEDLDAILCILEEHDCKATFFVTGEWATKYPEEIKKIYQGGHDIGNHGATHKHMPTISREEMISEIEGCHNIVKSIIGVDMDLFRPPYGDYNESVVMTAKAQGYYSIQWDVDSLDWKDYGVDAIINTVCNHKALKNGSIILLHNGSTYTAEALDELLTNLESKGYEFLPVSELIYRDGYTIDHTGRQKK
ncbi:MAG: polysaccharide deacetylase family protein [Lachnospiraceae bacterium]|nr:polysaccharide deacetylase family protein [Lachnospiraceae bacterium]